MRHEEDEEEPLCPICGIRRDRTEYNVVEPRVGKKYILEYFTLSNL